MATLMYGDDVVLLRRIAAGDREAFEALYRRHAPRVTQVLRAAFRLDGDLPDVVQDVFLQVWLNARDYDPARGPVTAWLLVIARSRALDLLRRKARMETADSDLPEPVEAQATDAGLDTIWLSAALATLPAQQRFMIHLSFYLGFTHSQIARQQGRPLGTVKTQIRSSVRMLRQAALAGSGWKPLHVHAG